MRLANAMVVYAISNYLKLYVMICPLCSLWQYYNAARHVHIILAELVLVLAVASIMFGSLALTKMDCNRIANYFLLPVLFGLAYLNLTHHHREIVESRQQSARRQPAGLVDSSPTSLPPDDNARASVNTSGGSSVADAVELILCNRLVALSLVHMTTNMFSEQIAQIVS